MALSPPAATTTNAASASFRFAQPSKDRSSGLYLREDPMSRNGFAAVASLILVLSSVSGISRETRAQDAKTQYPGMAPLDQYLMADRNAEIALARSAAPTSISRDATVLVFEKSGYQTAAEGKNGFTCLVERAWMSPFDSPEFWNPKMRGPICYNPAAGADNSSVHRK